jgi:hypothetical protein
MRLQGIRLTFKKTAEGAFSKNDERGARGYVVRGDGGARLSHSRVGSIGDVHAGASLAVRRRL